MGGKPKPTPQPPVRKATVTVVTTSTGDAQEQFSSELKAVVEKYSR